MSRRKRPAKKPAPLLYLAYGSNLNAAQMRARCPGSIQVGAATLRGWRLGFVGWSTRWEGAVATIRPCLGSTVTGLLWALTPEDAERLDGFEGAPTCYRRRKVVVDLDGKRTRAFTYVSTNREEAFPSQRYFDVIHSAYRRLGFDPEPLLSAATGGEA